MVRFRTEAEKETAEGLSSVNGLWGNVLMELKKNGIS